jgi:hypothetical protein
MPVDRKQAEEALKIVRYMVGIIAGIVQIKFYLFGDPPQRIPKRLPLDALIKIKDELKNMKRTLRRFDPEEFVKHYNNVKEDLLKLVPGIEIENLSIEMVEPAFKNMQKEFKETRKRPLGYYIIRAFISVSLYPLLAQIVESIKKFGSSSNF